MKKRILMKLTSLATVAHGEAAVNAAGPSNLTLFHRQATRLERSAPPVDRGDALKALQGLLSTYAFTEATHQFLASLSGSELIACLFVSQYPLIYRGDGDGLFSGTERYTYLATRLADAAASCVTLPTVWNFTARKLGLPMAPESSFAHMQPLFSLPRPIQAQVITTILKATELIVMGARLVADEQKEVTKKNRDEQTINFLDNFSVYHATEEQVKDLTTGSQEAIVVRLPCLSGNSLRHCMIREPGALRLLDALGFSPSSNPIPVGIERLLFGGGNTAAKVKEPASADMVEATMRLKYPLVDAVGGAVDDFLLTRSATSIVSWIICKENNFATEPVAGIRSDVSLLDMIDETTRTRMGIGGKSKEAGQMIFSYEILAAGLPVLVSVDFQAFTPDLTRSCVVQALEDWRDSGGYLGAKTAQGHGRFSMEYLQAPDVEGSAYLKYLEEYKESLAVGLLDKTMGTQLEVCKA